MMKGRLQTGFSLIELVLVIILLSIVLLVASVLNPTPTIEVQRQAERLLSDIRYMQHLAMTQNSRKRINFTANQYTLTELNGTTAVNHPTLTGNVVAMPAGVTISTSNLPNAMVVFNGRGQPFINNVLPGTALTTAAVVTLTGPDGSATVTILPETGRVSIP